MASLQGLLQPLTPVKAMGRRKRPSFSPVKHFIEQKPRTFSEQNPQKPEISDPQYHVPTAALTFRDFSFWNQAENDYDNLSSKDMNRLLEYMEKTYGIDDIHHAGPFLILRGDEIPSQDLRPFTIGGCLAVWLTRTQPLPREILIGNHGMGPKITLSEEHAQDLAPYRIPPTSTLLSIWEENFANAEAISYITTGIVVELPRTDRVAFLAQVSKSPARFSNSAVSLSYVNGPLVKDELGRLKEPQPQYVDGDYDDTDYVKEEGCFFPGCMISSSAGEMVSAGVAVEKGQEFRITVSFHCWGDEYDERMDKLGDPDFFKVAQGNSPIGYVSSRITSTDIGLATLNEGVKFNNRFLGVEATAKVLIPSEKIRYRDEFVVDGFTTSVQRLVCLGKRIRKEEARSEDLYHPNSNQNGGLPAAGTCIILEQGVMATGEPELRGSPRIREGVCGSALLRVRNSKGDDVTENGEIAGFMHWADLQSTYNTENPPPLLCYCESTDDLITQGWKIVQAGENTT